MSRCAGLLLIGLLLSTACSRVEPATIAERAHAIESQVWSPYCPGRLLVDCTTKQARDLRTSIERRLRRGSSSADVIEWIRRDYGSQALARPSSWPVWVVPGAIIALGAVGLGLLMRRWTRSAPASRAPSPSDAHLRRIRDEVEREL